MISRSVGRGGVNNPVDVKWVQERLNNCNAKITVVVDGVFGPTTAAAIDYFQGRFLGLRPNGLVTPSESTAIKLSQTPMGCWAPKDMLQLPSKGTTATIQATDFARAAGALNVSLATIKAIASVESKGNGFDTERRPVILYEPICFPDSPTESMTRRFPCCLPGCGTRLYTIRVGHPMKSSRLQVLWIDLPLYSLVHGGLFRFSV